MKKIALCMSVAFLALCALPEVGVGAVASKKWYHVGPLKPKQQLPVITSSTGVEDVGARPATASSGAGSGSGSGSGSGVGDFDTAPAAPATKTSGWEKIRGTLKRSSSAPDMAKVVLSARSAAALERSASVPVDLGAVKVADLALMQPTEIATEAVGRLEALIVQNGGKFTSVPSKLVSCKPGYAGAIDRLQKGADSIKCRPAACSALCATRPFPNPKSLQGTYCLNLCSRGVTMSSSEHTRMMGWMQPVIDGMDTADFDALKARRAQLEGVGAGRLPGKDNFIDDAASAGTTFKNIKDTASKKGKAPTERKDVGQENAKKALSVAATAHVKAYLDFTRRLEAFKSILEDLKTKTDALTAALQTAEDVGLTDGATLLQTATQTALKSLGVQFSEWFSHDVRRTALKKALSGAIGQATSVESYLQEYRTVVSGIDQALGATPASVAPAAATPMLPAGAASFAAASGPEVPVVADAAVEALEEEINRISAIKNHDGAVGERKAEWAKLLASKSTDLLRRELIAVIAKAGQDAALVKRAATLLANVK